MWSDVLIQYNIRIINSNSYKIKIFKDDHIMIKIVSQCVKMYAGNYNV